MVAGWEGVYRRHVAVFSRLSYLLLPHYFSLSATISLYLPLPRTSNNCCLQADSQMSQTRVLFSDFFGCFSSSALQLFSCSALQFFNPSALQFLSSLVASASFFFGCIVIMFAIKLMKSFALLPINLCFAIRIPLLLLHSLPQSRLKVCYLIVQSMPRSKLAGDKLIPNFTSRQQIAFHLFSFCHAHFASFPILFFTNFISQSVRC